MSVPRILLALGWLALGCNGSDGPGTGPPAPSGPAPSVSVSLAFGEPPLEGFLYLRPQPQTKDWGYSVDADEDGIPEHEGMLQAEIGFAYRFMATGVHRIRVELAGPHGTETIDMPVVVIDPEATGIQILVQRDISGPVPPHLDNSIFEGITINRAGTELFVGDFWSSVIHQLDPATLQEMAPPLLLESSGAEGLSVAPSDTILLVGHKRHRLSVVAIPSMELRRDVFMDGEFFVHALDDATALSSGLMGFDVIDTNSGHTIAGLPMPRAWHFAVSPTASIVAVLNRYEPAAIHLASLPNLQEIASIELTDIVEAQNVAFDPAGDRLYVMGQDEQGSRFLLLDLPSLSILRSLPLGPGSCWILCVANPVAVSRSGRFVAMEQGSGVYFIDTALDLPRFHSDVGNSVAASPTEEAFYLLRSDGLLSKITLRP